MLSLKSFIDSVLAHRSWLHSELVLGYHVRWGPISSRARRYRAFPAAFVRDRPFRVEGSLQPCSQSLDQLRGSVSVGLSALRPA